MDEARLDLELRWADVAEIAGVTPETLRQIRKGPGDIRPLTRRGIERALNWERGSVTEILNGGKPKPSTAVQVRQDVPSVSKSHAELLRFVNGLDEAGALKALRVLHAAMYDEAG